MKIGIIDADLIGRPKHRFPNLVCMKISGYHKQKGDTTKLLTDYVDIPNYDKVYVSKVFTDTPFPELLLKLPNVEHGGTGFYFDKAPNLPDEIEHSFPDYHLYDEYVQYLAEHGAKKSEFKDFTEASIGFLTRGCFRKCGFCVNKKYDHVFQHSPLDEFYDPERKRICMLDDNFLGCPQWKVMLRQLIDTGKPFCFKQGLDERLLTDEKCEMLFNAKYYGDYTFAFDKIQDFELIESKLKLIRKYTNKKNIKFYVLCGFESTDITDIENTFKRIELLMRYGCRPYIMRYQNENEKPYLRSELRGIYIQLARWCNQPNLFKKMSFRELCYAGGAQKQFEDFCNKYPDVANKYSDLKCEEQENKK